MTWPWIFLGVSLVGAWFTINAFRPSSRWQILAVSFFAAWFTGELALWHLVWQATATVILVGLGALEAWPGWVALGITLASWVGLISLAVTSRRSAGILDASLAEGLGVVDRPVEYGIPFRRLVFPLYLRDRRVERVKDLQYGPAGRRNRLDVYRPRGGARPGAPVLLQIHGGAWIIGDKGQQGLPLMLDLAATGWVCVAINYRLSPRATWPEHLVDCKRALAWIRENIAEYGGDPDTVIVTGGSAGGHLAAMVGLTANDARYQPGFETADTSVVACVPFYGVYDFAEVLEHHGQVQLVGEWLSERVMKTSLAEDRDAFVEASPIAHVRRDAPPFFVIHGRADNLVPVVQAREFVTALRETSREPVLYAELPGASHAFDVFHSVRTGNVVRAVERFLEWVVRMHATAQARPRPAESTPGVASDPAATSAAGG